VKTKLFPYQREGVRLIEEFGHRALLADEMGLGKTIQALTAAIQSGARPIIIICEAGLKYHWRKEVRHHFSMDADVLEGMKAPRRWKFRQPRRITIVNYDILGGWKLYLSRLDPEFAIVDEGQKIKNRDAQRTQHVQDICRWIPKLTILSGTPLTNRPAELWPALNLLWPDEFKSFYPFARRYCEPRIGFRGKWEYKGASNLPELHKKLKRLGMIRRLKADVLPDLPKKQRIVIPVPITDERQYKMAEREFVQWLLKYYRKPWASAERLVQIGHLKRLAAWLKMRAVFNWLDNFLENTDEKLIIFAIHKKIIRAIKDRYPRISLVVDGSVTGLDRQFAYNQFSKSRQIRFMIAQSVAGGTGWNGTAASKTLTVEPPWTSAELLQQEDRPHRIGQLMPVTSYVLVAKDTIEEMVCDRLDSKHGVLTEVLDGHSGRTLDIRTQLINHYLKLGARR
jgi:SWI/SNF-related matrix-associated actin-dependent regulator 1 of chromatin subfamily A